MPEPTAPPLPTERITCPVCSASAVLADRFCEECGTELQAAVTGLEQTAAPGACAQCGSTESTEGYCDRCGARLARPRDHIELDLPIGAGISDRGLRHHRNEDSMAIGHTTGPGDLTTIVAVVCDGVSSSARPHEASLAATEAAAAAMLEATRAGASPEEASTSGVEAAAAAVTAMAASRDQADPPASTYVSALIRDGEVVVTWIGDSRAYWLGEDARQLTVDDSWATQMIAAGALTEEQAMADNRSHALVGWLGADAERLKSHQTTFQAESPGILLLCSDGLWNYLDDPAELAERVTGTTPHAAAETLVGYALEAGGHDNITVTLIPVHPTQTPTPSSGS